jgi:hypothetical protein
LRKLIVHIGQAKTGTSSLQNALDAARKSLAAYGVLYPRTSPGTQHSGILAALLGPEFAPELAQRRLDGDPTRILAESKAGWQAILDDVARTDPHTIILSAEAFYDAGVAGKAPTLIRHFRQLADDITVVAYLRAPADLYLSLRQQNLKFFGIAPPPTPNQTSRNSLQPFMDIDGVTVKVHAYDPKALIGNDVVSDFVARQLPPEAAAQVKHSPDRINTSISPEAMAVLEDIHQSRAPAGQANVGPLTAASLKIVAAADARLPGKARPTYKPGVAALVHDTATDLEWLADSFDITFTRPAVQHIDVLSADLKLARDLVVIDEARYQALWYKIAKPLRFQKLLYDWPLLGRLVQAWRTNPIARLRHRLMRRLKGRT